MATKTHFLDGGSAQYSAAELMWIANYLLSEGIMPNADGSLGLQVQQSGTPDMNVVVTIGAALVEFTKSSVVWKVAVELDANQSVAIASNSSGSNRVDAIVLKIDDVAPNLLKTNVATILRVAGTGTSALSNGAIDTAIGHTSWVRLANVTVPNAASSITNANIANTLAAVSLGKTLTKVLGDGSALSGIVTNPIATDVPPDTDNLRKLGTALKRYIEIYGVDIYASFFHGDGSLLTNLNIQNVSYDRIAGENMAIRNVAAELVIDESFATGTDERTVGFDSSVTRVGQGFQLPVSQTISEFTVNIKRVGTPGSPLRAAIYSDSAGSPGTLIASEDIPVANIATTYSDITIPLSTPVAITANTQYHIVLSLSDDGTNTSNYFMWQGASAGGYANGQTKLYNGSAWSADGSRDCRFAIKYTGVKKADDGSVSLSRVLGFVQAAFNARASGKIQVSGQMSGFTLPKYNSGGEATLFDSGASNTTFRSDWSSGARTFRQYFTADEIGLITGISIHLFKNNSGNDIGWSLYKRRGSDQQFELLGSGTLAAASQTNDAWHRLYLNQAVDGGGAFYVGLSGTGNSTNYSGWSGKGSGDGLVSQIVGSNFQIKDYGVRMHGVARRYIVGQPVYLQNSGAISYKPEDIFSQVVARVVDHTSIEINPPAPTKLIGKASSVGSFGNSVTLGYYTVPPNTRKIIAEVAWYNYTGGTNGTAKETIVMERPGVASIDFAQGVSGFTGVSGSIAWSGDLLIINTNGFPTDGDLYLYA